jgi:hypothetical protein
MADTKETAVTSSPTLAPASQAPTIAPSTTSLSDVEKDRPITSEEKKETSVDKTQTAADDDAADASSVERASIVPGANADADNALEKHATAASKAGHSLHAVQTREDGTEYPTGTKLFLITLALCLAVFLVALG